MTRYFLHVQDGSDMLEDPCGQIFADLAAAEREAAAAARDLMAEALRCNEPLGLKRMMLINDEAGHTVSTVAFTAALPGDPLRNELAKPFPLPLGSNFARSWRPR
jgi:Domain of unknown function (DUF6894)